MDLVLSGVDFKVCNLAGDAYRDEQTQLISVHKLSKYVDISQLPEQFGGNLAYDAEEWSNNREVSRGNGQFQGVTEDRMLSGPAAEQAEGRLVAGGTAAVGPGGLLQGGGVPGRRTEPDPREP